MYARFVAALCTGAFLVPAAEAAISVNFNFPNQPQVLCAAAENVRLTPAPTLSGIRFSFECLTDGLSRTCQPAPYTPPPAPHPADGDYLPGAPFVKYQPTAGGASILVACDASQGAAPLSIKGTEVAGIAGTEAIQGCHPASNVEFQPNVSVESCITGSGAGTASCLR